METTVGPNSRERVRGFGIALHIKQIIERVRASGEYLQRVRTFGHMLAKTLKGFALLTKIRRGFAILDM